MKVFKMNLMAPGVSGLFWRLRAPPEFYSPQKVKKTNCDSDPLQTRYKQSNNLAPGVTLLAVPRLLALSGVLRLTTTIKTTTIKML